MQITLRPAYPDDFAFCEDLYFSGMESINRELKLNIASQAASLRQTWQPAEVRIIALNEVDVGWLQCAIQRDAIFLGQLFIQSSLQGQGIGTEVMQRVIAEAEQACKAITLGVVKINPAIRLYERLGFRIASQDKYKFYMKRDPVAGTDR